jgi:hypothetical protein
MSDSRDNRTRTAPALTLLAAGLAMLAFAWSLPVNLGSVTLPLLRRAGEGTPTVAQIGRQWVQSEKIGPASLLLKAAQGLKDPGSKDLERAVGDLATHQAELVAWGGFDPFLDPLFKLREKGGQAASTPVVGFLITEQARASLRTYLGNSRSLGVQSLLRLRQLDATGRFVPAARPGGQALDTVILLGALLYQGEHLSPVLQRELRQLADAALERKQLGELEPVFLDLLSLSKRLDWVQLCELLRRTEDTKTVGEFAHLARVAPDDFALIYAATLFSSSADRVALFLLKFGKTGLEDLRSSMALGQGATGLLLERQVPVNRGSTPDIGGAATFALLYPRLALGLRWLAALAGAFALLKAVDRLLFRAQPGFGPALPHVKSGVLALLLAGLFALATEPFLLKGAPVSEFKVRLVLPALAASSAQTAPATPSHAKAMDTNTLLSIGFFAALQVAMYLVCLMKIREIDRRPLVPLVKLKLMENEENLFDGGLYIGIGGTATALVLQVLQIIEPNLLAAYSSNLFGITCVALVKIRHVRPYKCALILQGQSALAEPAAQPPPIVR